MNQEQHYYDDAGGTGTSIVSSPETSITGVIPLSPIDPESRAYRKMARQAEMVVTRTGLRTGIAGDGIMKTAALSSLADTMSDAVPSCEPYVRSIVDTFVTTVRNQLTRY